MGGENDSFLLEIINEDENEDEQPYDELLQYLQEHNFNKFKETLMQPRATRMVRESFISRRHGNFTLLEEVCRGKHICGYLDLLLNIEEINVNFQNPFHEYRAALHYVVERQDSNMLYFLIKGSDSLDVNIEDERGNTALHLAARENAVKIMSMLLNQKLINVSKMNRNEQTALHVALKKEHRSCIWMLIDHVNYVIDKRVEDILKEKFPQFKTMMDAYKYLFHNELNKFDELISAKLIDVDGCNGRYTFLQYASMKGLFEAVHLLINRGAKLNLTCSAESGIKTPPFMLAGKGGFNRILQFFISHDKTLVDKKRNKLERLSYKFDTVETKNQTILHAVITGFNDRFLFPERVPVTSNPDDCSHLECLRILFNNNHYDSVPRFDINQINSSGETALSLAVSYHQDEKIIHSLLINGAYIGHDDVLKYIDPNIFEEFLNDCIANVKDKDDLSEYSSRQILKISYNYQFLHPPKMSKVPLHYKYKNKKLETDAIIQISKVSELRHFLTHPTLSSFLNLKWCLVRGYFWMNVVFYSLFCLFLTWYIVDKHDNSMGSPMSKEDIGWPGVTPVCAITYIFLFFLSVREILQFCISPKLHLKNIENYLELFIIIFTTVTLYLEEHNKGEWITPGIIDQIGSLNILLCWSELIMLIGRHPYFATELEMLKVTGLSSLKFFAWYLILTCAFGLSLHVLLRVGPLNGDNGNKTTPEFAQYSLEGITFKKHRSNDSINCVTNSSTVSAECYNYFNKSDLKDWVVNVKQSKNDMFQSWNKSIFKTIVMSTGEFTVDDIPFAAGSFTGYLVYLLFIFIIGIMFFNLFIGLAVSDTDRIQKDAEVIELVRRAENIQFLETMIENRVASRFQFIMKYVNLFPMIAGREKKVIVYPGAKNMVHFTGRSTLPSRFGKKTVTWLIDDKIVKESVNILQRRKFTTSQVVLENLKDEIKNMKGRVEYLCQEFKDHKINQKKSQRDIILLLSRINEKLAIREEEGQNSYNNK